MDEAVDAEILGFGDSLLKQGLIPRILEERLGKRTYNLAVGGGLPVASYLLFRKALEAGARPSAVLVDFEPVMLALRPMHSANRLAEVASFADCLDVGWTYGSSPYFNNLATAKLLPSLRYRTEIRRVVVDALAGGPPTDSFVARSWQRWKAERGVHQNPDTSPDQTKSPFWDERFASHMPLRCDRRSVDYIVRFFTLAEERGIPVYWLLPPTHPEIQAARDAGKATAFYTEFVRKMQARFPDLTVVDARHSGLPRNRFYDACHLDGRGARAFSTQVAKVLLRLPSGDTTAPRWVSLSGDRIDTIRQTAAGQRPSRRR
jgi:hypothetical protein